MGGVKVRIADLNDPRVATLIEAHATFARAQTGRGSAHALDLADLRTPGTAVWAARLRGAPLSVAALRRLSHGHGKVKSRHTTEAARRSGVGRALLGQLISVACGEGLARLSLETGSWPYFEPARAFYASCGFVERGPFGDYASDPNSVFMTVALP
jgi:putative acetyltransferase